MKRLINFYQEKDQKAVSCMWGNLKALVFWISATHKNSGIMVFFYYTILTLSFVFKLSKILTRMYPHGKVGVHAQGTKIVFGILEYLDMDLGILRYY